VKSKVARCLKVQKKTAKANKKKHQAVEDNSDEALLSKALSVEPYGLKFGSKIGTWAERAKEAFKPREEEIREREQEMYLLESKLMQKILSNSPKIEKIIHRVPSPPPLPVITIDLQAEEKSPAALEIQPE